MDTRKPLTEVNAEWQECTRCQLGERRDLRGAPVLPFHGSERRGVLFVASSPDEEDEQAGAAFGGSAGLFVRFVCREAGFRDDEVSFTYVTACRACTPMLDSDGTPRVRKTRSGFVLMVKDTEPPKEAVTTCLARVHETIYTLDPYLIVGMGKEACVALAGPSTSAPLGDPGVYAHEIRVPGASHRASLTPKLRSWARTVRGTTTYPTIPYEVRYLMLSVRDHRRAYYDMNNKAATSTSSLFLNDVRNAHNIYRMYMEKLDER